jgi:two-component system sensor histidine kinase DegS
VIQSTEGKRLVYRLVQETLNNIGKHSKASHIDFSIAVDDSVIVMKLVDNGQGFDLQEVEQRHPDHKGIGLTAMVERTNMLDGTVEINSKVGSGTSVIFTLPLQAELVQGGTISSHER